MKKSVTHSPDGLHHAYCLSQNYRGMRLLIHDGQEIKLAYNIEYITFSPDSNRLAYFSNDERQWRLTIDRRTAPAPPPIAPPVFSPDSRSLAYWTRDGQSVVLIINGQTQQPYDQVRRDSLVFTPGDNRPGYFARSGQDWYLVTGNQQRLLETKPMGRLVFDSDADAFVQQLHGNKPNETAVAEVPTP